MKTLAYYVSATAMAVAFGLTASSASAQLLGGLLGGGDEGGVVDGLLGDSGLGDTVGGLLGGGDVGTGEVGIPGVADFITRSKLRSSELTAVEAQRL